MVAQDQYNHIFHDADESPTDLVEIRDTDNHDSRIIPFGQKGYGNGLLTVENGLDQDVVATVLGRNIGDTNWQTAVSATTVTSGSQGSLQIGVPWGQIRVRFACAVGPATGSVSGRLVRSENSGGSVSGSGVSSTDVTDRAARDLGKVDIADIDGFASVAGQAVMASSLPVTMASDQTNQNVAVATIADNENHLGEVGTDVIEITVTPTITAGLYAALDALGGLLTFASVVRAAGRSALITKVVVVDEADQGAPLELVLFNQTFAATADNAAFNPTDADMANCIGFIDIAATDYASFSANSVAAKSSGLRMPFPVNLVAAGTSLFGQLRVAPTGAPTYAAIDDVTVKITVERL